MTWLLTICPVLGIIAMAMSASSIVTGSFSRMSSVTGFWMRSDSPRSPFATPPSQ